MALYLGSTEINNPAILSGIGEIRLGNELIWQSGLPVGTTFDFGYTGQVQEITLPRGRYKLQCWGAQGGTSYGSSAGVGSKGGYSEGVLNLPKKTTLYIFVGGSGSRGSSSSLVNGGWNGGGASVGYSSYNSGGTNGYSYPACGGGATDIATVTSTMSYSSGRTNRSAASLLARCIVAGGGAGGSYRYTTVTTTSTTTSTSSSSGKFTSYSSSASYAGLYGSFYNSSSGSVTFSNSYSQGVRFWIMSSSNSSLKSVGVSAGGSSTTSIPSGASWVQVTADGDLRNASGSVRMSWPVEKTTTSTSNSSGYSNQTQQGGGTSGRGQYPGTQSAAGSGGGFGYGANQTTTGYRYCAGAGGGGWYGGGTAHSDSSTSYVNYSGGGSGFVNTASNASYRPSGYTGLELESGTTTAGNVSHPSVSGGTETGHSGNGYARITVLNSKYTTIPYIESTGTQYIDTGFKPNQDTRVIIDTSFNFINEAQPLFGQRTNTSLNRYEFLEVSNKLYSPYNSELGSVLSVEMGRMLVDKDKNITKINGSVITTATYASFQGTNNLYLFASNNNGSLVGKSYIKMYSCKIYDNDVLVRDFVPKLNPDGVAGLWDNVNKVFYKSAGSSEFIAGT